MTARAGKSVRWAVSTIIWAIFIGCSPVFADATPTLETQRKLYDQAQAWLDAKDSRRYLAIRSQLLSYPLTPYLDYRTFLINLGDKSPKQVSQFIHDYQKLPFSGRIAVPYIRTLAQEKQWQKLVDFTTDIPSGEIDQCFFYTAHWYLGNKEFALSGAKQLWLQGKSVAEQCDELFIQLELNKKITDELLLDRITLAYEAGNQSLIHYLSKKLTGAKSKRQAKLLSSLYSAPDSVKSYLDGGVVKSIDWPLFVLGLERLTKISPEKAQELLVMVRTSAIPPNHKEVIKRISERTAARFMDANDDKFAVWRDKVLRTSNSDYYLEQRVRVAIEQNDWAAIHRWATRLSPEVQQQSEWQYWLGRAERALGKTQYGGDRLFQILGQRNFYSVSAARELNQPITFPFETLTYRPELIAEFSTSLDRISELLARSKNTAARSEWYWLLRRSTQEQKSMLANYALEHNWPHFSVVAAINAKLWNNLVLRFPIAHLNSFEQVAERHQLDPLTLMSLARQESALDNMARSHVGARGLMQLMPKTARYTAKKYQLLLANDAELYEPEKNIEIGTQYFAELMKKYSNNRVLALAAYNAGTNRVDRWLRERGGKLDVFQFIESIPFKETRHYVQNILMFETYYRQQLGVDSPFFSDVEINAKY